MLLVGVSAAVNAQTARPLPVTPVRAHADVTTWPDSARRAMRDSLVAARRKWERTRPLQYDIAMTRAPSLIAVANDQRYDGHLRFVRVIGDSMVATMFERAPQFTRGTAWSDITVDRLFRYLESVVADSARQVDRLELDPTFGYPTRWHTDDARNGYGGYVTDKSDGGDVVLFRSVPQRAKKEPSQPASDSVRAVHAWVSMTTSGNEGAIASEYRVGPRQTASSMQRDFSPAVC